MFDGSTFCCDEDEAALVDEFAKEFTNVLPSTIAFGLSSSTSYEVIGIFVAREDEFVGIGAVSAIVVDAVDEGLSRDGFCLFCASNSEVSFNPNPNSFDYSQNFSDYSLQPQHETYPYELSGNDSHHGYDCPLRFPLVYEQEPCYNQNFNENYYPHNSPSFLCCDNYEGPHESFQCESMNQNFFEPNPCYEPNSSSFDQYQPSQSFVTQQLPQRSNEDIRLEMAKLTKSIRILLNDNTFSHEEASMEVLLAKERILKLIQAWDDKQIELWSFPELLPQFLNNSRTIEEAANLAHAQPEDTNELFQKLLEDLKIIREELAEYINSSSWNYPTFYDNEEYSIQYKKYLENSSDAIAPVLPTEEPEYSLSMGYENLSTITETESDEVTKSSVKNLVPIPNHSEILSDSNNDDISSDDDAFEDIEYVEASPPYSELISLEEENDVYQEDEEFDLEDILQIQDVILREKLLSINRLISYIESLNNNPTPDRVLKSSSSFPIFEESNNSLSYSNNSSPEFETFSDNTEESRSGSTTTHANNSFPEYDLFCFEIEPDQERLTSVVMKDISDDSSNDPLLKEVDLFLASDNLIPPGIENIDYDSEGDIHFLEELLVDNSIPFPENESSDFDHQDDPSFPRPFPEPPDVEFFFDYEPNSEEVISYELNKDECFDPGGEINVFANVEDDDYFPFIFVIRIFLPYLIYPEVSPLLLSAESEDTIFDHGISI
nr:hypothetical protein [Tanacetum cinerariifolium]